MTTRETHRSLPETWKFFDPSAFALGDEVAYHDPDTNRWEKGRLATTPPIIDRDNRRIFLENTGTGGIELRIPPKKVDKAVLNKTIKISIEDVPGSHTLVDYQVQRDAAGERQWNIGPDGEVEVTLVPVTAGRNHKEISNVNIDTLKNYQEVEEVENAVDAQMNTLRTQVDAINNIRRKELLAKLSALDKKVHKLVEETGHFDELGDLEPGQIKTMSTQIKELRRQAEEGAREIEAALRTVTTEIGNRGAGDAGKKRAATGMNTRIDRMQADNEKAFTDYQADQLKDRAYRQWQNEHAVWTRENVAFNTAHTAWEAAVAAAGAAPAAAPAGGGRAGGGGAANPGKEPTFSKVEPIAPEVPAGLVLPTTSREKAINANEIFNTIRANVVAPGPQAADAAFEPHRNIIAEVERRLTERKRDEGLAATDSYNTASSPQLEQRITGEIFSTVLEEWNARDVRVEMNFDFAAEQTELKTKINELLVEADANGVNNRATELRAHLNTLNTYTKGTAGVETLLANIWTDIGRIEIDLFKNKNRKSANRSEQEKNIDVDIPHTVLMDIFATRPQEVYNVMAEAYRNQGSNMRGAIETALRRVFEPSPTQNGPRVNGNLQADEAMIARLRQYGIKDWRHFKKLWDEKLAPRAAVMMHEWAQDDVRNEAARNSSTWDKVWALRGQIASRIGLNIALVGGGALAVGAAIGSGGIGAMALGGAVGGGIRAGLQKFVFGHEKFEKRKEEILKELEDRQREQAINNLLARRFGGNHANNPNFEQDSLRMFSSMLAQAAREASAEFVVKDTAVDRVGLNADSRRLYIQAIRDIEKGGDVPSEREKLACAIAIKKLQERTAESIEEAAEGDPLVIRILDGVMAGYSGRSASKENYGLGGAATTVAIGAAAGAAFYAYNSGARMALGGIGGAAAGYHLADARFNRRELDNARNNAEAMYNQAAQLMEQILRDREAGAVINQANLIAATDQVQRLNRLLHGNADNVAEKQVAQLLVTPGETRLRKEIENLVYQAYRRGIFAQRALGALENHANAATREDQVTVANKTNAWFRKNGARAVGLVGGAALGAGAAFLAGFATRELKELMGIHPPAEAHTGTGSKTGNVVKATEVAAATKAASELVPAHVEPAPAAAPVENSAYHEKGFVSVDHPNNIHNVSQWRHSIMEQMGYKFHGGKIDHALMFHEGAKIQLVGADGKVVDTFTFKHGDSTWRALDHLENKAAHMIKGGEMPGIKIVGAENGKVEILDNYKVESHTGGKTHLVEGKAVEKPAIVETHAPAKDLDTNNFKDAPLAKASLDEHNLRHADGWSESGDLVRGKDGSVYSTMYPDHNNPLMVGHASYIPGGHIRYVDVHNHIYDGQGKYVGDAGHHADNVAAKSTAGFENKGNSGGGSGGSSDAAKTEVTPDKIKWTEGKNLTKVEAARLDTLLHGSKSGGGGVENSINSRVGNTTEVPSAKAGVAEVNNTSGAKAETPVTASAVSSPDTQVDASADIPPAFKPQYAEWSEVKQDFSQSFNRDLGVALEDKANLMPRFLDKVELAFKQQPGLLKDAAVQRVLDNTHLTAGEKLNNLAAVMAEKHLFPFSKEEQLIFGDIDDIPADSDDFEKFTITNGTGQYEVAVAKGDGAHVAVYKSLATGKIYIQTDPTKLFTRGSEANS